jgi:hypothetical protein
MNFYTQIDDYKTSLSNFSKNVGFPYVGRSFIALSNFSIQLLKTGVQTVQDRRCCGGALSLIGESYHYPTSSVGPKK